MKRMLALMLVVSLPITMLGCASMSRTEKGALAGAAIGTAAGAIIGAAVGGVAGAYIGNYMDKQAAEIERDLEGARVERIGEGIKITFDSGILFDVDRSELRPEARSNLTNLAVILNKYADTNVLIEGHTDSTGPEEYNLALSDRRAKSVSNYLAVEKVDPTRFTVMGYGESQPIEDNATAAGRQANRRVEIAIMANEKLKKAAKDQAG